VSSFLLAIAVARQTGVPEFAEFSLVVLLYLLASGGIRAAVTDTALAARGEPAAVHRATERTMLIAVVVAAVLLASALALQSEYGIVLAIALPLLCALDLVRTVEAGVGHPAVSLLLGVAWALPSLVLSAVSLFVPVTPIVLFSTWAGAGAAAGALALAVRRLPWRPRWRAEARETRAAVVFFADYVVGSGGAMGTTALLGAFAGAPVIAAIRGAGALLGPVTLIATTSKSLVIPALSRREGGASSFARAVKIAVAMSAIAVPLLTLVALLPSAWGQALLGPSWTVVAPVVLPMVFEAYFALLSGVPAAGLRARLAGRRTLLLRLVIGVPRPFVVIGAAIAGGASGAAWSMAALALLNVVIWWVSYARLERRES
jgi:hypothetical protein